MIILTYSISLIFWNKLLGNKWASEPQECIPSAVSDLGVCRL